MARGCERSHRRRRRQQRRHGGCRARERRTRRDLQTWSRSSEQRSGARSRIRASRISACGYGAAIECRRRHRRGADELDVRRFSTHVPGTAGALACRRVADQLQDLDDRMSVGRSGAVRDSRDVLARRRICRVSLHGRLRFRVTHAPKVWSGSARRRAGTDIGQEISRAGCRTDECDELAFDHRVSAWGQPGRSSAPIPLVNHSSSRTGSPVPSGCFFACRARPRA